MANLPQSIAFRVDPSANTVKKYHDAASGITDAVPHSSPESTRLSQAEAVSRFRNVEDIDANHAGPRKLIRPSLPLGVSPPRGRRNYAEPQLTTHQEWQAAQSSPSEGSHAEAFYFQKQMQSQTLMVFVLSNGEKIEGYIEWYDRHAIKLRNGSRRVLIYKSAIKYIYKAADITGGV